MEATAVATEEEAEAWVYPNVTYRCSWAYFLGYMLTSSFSCSEIASFVVRWIRWWCELCMMWLGFFTFFNASHQKLLSPKNFSLNHQYGGGGGVSYMMWLGFFTFFRWHLTKKLLSLKIFSLNHQYGGMGYGGGWVHNNSYILATSFL